LEVGSNDDISILVGGLRLDHHVISVTDVLLNHGLTLDKEGIDITSLYEGMLNHLKQIRSTRINIEWTPCGNGSLERNTRTLDEFDASPLSRHPDNPLLFC
jgi:hypothetical protein